MASQDRLQSNIKDYNHPRVSEEDKDIARAHTQALGTEAGANLRPRRNDNMTEDDLDAIVDEVSDANVGKSSLATGDAKQGSEHNRVMGGYKATLKNPRVSDEAKQHAEQMLKEHDAN